MSNARTFDVSLIAADGGTMSTSGKSIVLNSGTTKVIRDDGTEVVVQITAYIPVSGATPAMVKKATENAVAKAAKKAAKA